MLLRYVVSRVHFQAELYLRVQRERGLPPELQQVLEVINRRYAEPAAAERAGGQCGVVGAASPRPLSRPSWASRRTQALIRRRIQVARELLAGTSDPIKSIAGRCGFPNAAAFCVQFRKATRIAPTAYRERQL